MILYPSAGVFDPFIRAASCPIGEADYSYIIWNTIEGAFQMNETIIDVKDVSFTYE